jgi:hypothetical protein
MMVQKHSSSLGLVLASCKPFQNDKQKLQIRGAECGEGEKGERRVRKPGRGIAGSGKDKGIDGKIPSLSPAGCVSTELHSNDMSR